eukprot:CAMPEP_0197180556 /NCGR_PEP_ID=MMETSP1423-20130617/5128_1 /TAXON_ID=476441 /ORGANISM="Pseudo-nitzschia heimii, Strain UNC1101" /LENGTH=241 /DNA_ID=CAMNT_0042630651 /DNA_START=30 /DNA_END=755 /DNA_ORIENTATION=-
MTTIRYFVPEDGDLESEPNVFLAPKPRNPNAPPTFGQIRDAFPLPGQYHFRFKTALVPGTDREKSAFPVWMDVSEERRPVPTWRNGIVVKVSRISIEDDDDDDDDDDDFASPAPTHAPPAPVARAPPSHRSGVSSGSIDDLFGAAPAPAAPPAQGGGSLLDFNNQHHHTPAPQPRPPPAGHTDFFGMGAPPSGVQSAPPSGGYHGNPSMYAQQQQQQMHMQQQQQQQQRPPQQHQPTFDLL